MVEIEAKSEVKDQVASLSDPIAALKLPIHESSPDTDPDDLIPKEIKIFFSTAAPKFLTPFYVGKQKLLLHGNPVAMALRSDFFSALLPKLASETGEIVLAGDIPLTEDRLLALLRVWLVINGVVGDFITTIVVECNEVPTLASLNLQVLLMMWEWINYFNIDPKSATVISFVESVLTVITSVKEGCVEREAKHCFEMVSLKIADLPLLQQIVKVRLARGFKREQPPCSCQITFGCRCWLDTSEAINWRRANAISSWFCPEAVPEHEFEILVKKKQLNLEIPAEKVAEVKMKDEATKLVGDIVQKMIDDDGCKISERVYSFYSGEQLEGPYSLYVSLYVRSPVMGDIPAGGYVRATSMPPINVEELTAEQLTQLAQCRSWMEKKGFRFV